MPQIVCRVVVELPLVGRSDEVVLVGTRERDAVYLIA